MLKAGIGTLISVLTTQWETRISSDSRHRRNRQHRSGRRHFGHHTLRHAFRRVVGNVFKYRRQYAPINHLQLPIPPAQGFHVR